MLINTINVKYKCIDQMHVFTSEDVRGLYVASSDFKGAYEALPEIVSTLLQFNYGVKINVYLENYIKEKEDDTLVLRIYAGKET